MVPHNFLKKQFIKPPFLTLSQKPPQLCGYSQHGGKQSIIVFTYINILIKVAGMEQEFDNLPHSPLASTSGDDTQSDVGELFAGDEDITRASLALKAMSHPLRLKILCTLGEQEVSVQEIVERVGTSQSNISQHLAILRDKGILASRKDANRVFYRVGDSRTMQLVGMMRDLFCQQR